MQPCRPHGARLSRVDGALHPGLRVKISLSMLVLIYSSSSRTMLPRSPAPIRQRSQCAILQVFTKSIEVLYSVLNTELSRFCSAASLLGTACASAPAGGAHLQGAQLHLLCDARRDRRRPVTAEPAATRISRRHPMCISCNRARQCPLLRGRWRRRWRGWTGSTPWAFSCSAPPGA